jgi:hypothetical protein
MNSQTKRVVMVDREQKLLDDKSGQYRRELLKKLHGFEGDMVRLIGAGVSAEKFEVSDNLRQALKGACHAIDKFR